MSNTNLEIEELYLNNKIEDLSIIISEINEHLKYLSVPIEKELELPRFVFPYYEGMNKYGDNFIVAPNIAIAHYLFNSKSVLPADWLINSEINKNPKLFIDIASNTKNFIFLEKSFLFREELMPLKKEDFSVITNYIYKNFYKIDETKYFIIYNGINKK